jgi:prevent-host-death family protein
MDTISIREARRRLGDVVNAAERGESTILTRHGRKVAQIAPAHMARKKGLPDLTEFRASLTIKGRSLSHTVTKARDRERY